MTSKGTVYVVDDDEAVRVALSGLLGMLGYTVAEFASGNRFLSRVKELSPGCILLDYWMPGLSGLEVQAALRAQNISFPVIFLTAHGDIPTGVAAMKAGAQDFLEKPVSDAVLVATLDQAFARLAAEMIRQARSVAMRSRLSALTPREREVTALVVAGLRGRQIASELGISLQTVKVHRMHSLAKLKVQSLPELARVWAEGMGHLPTQ